MLEMMFNVTSFLVAIQIVFVVYGQQEKFVIENKRTGMVVERIVGGHRLFEWDNTDSQLWTLEGHNSSGYIIRNVASRTFIQCNRGSVHYYKWKFNIPSETRIESKSSNIFIAQENQFLMCMYEYNSDENDRWLFIEQSKKNNMKFVIENKETGEILEEEGATIKMGKWDSKDSQLWTLKPQNKSGYSIVNVASGKVLTYSKNGSEYDAWKVKARGDTYIKVEHPNVFLANRNGKPVFIGDKQIDDSATWLLIDRETKQNKTEPKRIFIEDYQERFVIENWNTREVLQEVNTTLKTGKWENKDSQLWILKRNLSGYCIVNVASGGILTYDQNGTDLQIWNLNTQVASPVQLDGTNVFLSHKDGEVVSTENNQNNESDKWIFTEHTFKKIDKKPKQIHIKRYQSKFVIKNKKTGEVLEELDSTLKLRDWDDRGTQLWTLKPQNESGYSIVNVASGGILAYSNNGTTYDIWNLKTQSDSLIQIEGLNIFLANKNGKPVFIRYKQNDDTERWMLTERELMKINKKPKRIHVDVYEQKFVIENKKTGMVLDIPMEQYLGMRNWENRNTQMWTLEEQEENPQEKSGYYVIRNVANRGALTYLKNDTECQIWQLNSDGDTWIQLEGANVFLVDRDGEATFAEKKQDDESDRWLLVEYSSKRASMKSKLIYFEAQQSIPSM